jgi:hypothetical protein
MTTLMIAERLVASAGIEPDDVVLAVGPVNGLAHAAAATGAQVYAAPDVGGLPYADDQFDHVLSNFGVMTAARPRRALREMARVARCGATVAFTAWESPRAIHRICPPVHDLEIAEESIGGGRYCVISGHK